MISLSLICGVLLFTRIDGFSIHCSAVKRNISARQSIHSLYSSASNDGDASNISIDDDEFANNNDKQIVSNTNNIEVQPSEKEISEKELQKDEEEATTSKLMTESKSGNDIFKTELIMTPTRIDIETEKVNSTIDSTLGIESSAPITFQKYLTMQDKRVQVTFRYSHMEALRPYFLTVAKKITTAFPDVIIDRQILPYKYEESTAEDAVFEVIIDGRMIIGKTRSKWQPVRRNGNDVNNRTFGMSVFVSMDDIETAIVKARRKKRPSSTIYAQDESISAGIRLEGLKGSEKKESS